MLRTRKKQRQKKVRMIVTLSVLAVLLVAGCVLFFIKQSSGKNYAITYETEHYNENLYQGGLFAKELCVSAEDVALDGFDGDSSLGAAGLFDIKNQKVLYADRIHDRLYPASTTKILTAYLALKHGNMDDIVTISENAVNLDSDAQVCGLKAGDKIRLYDLICGLLLYSGNDAAIAVAEHISGSVEAFVEQMNQEAQALGATNSHFVNPHGLHDEEQYTTAYDLYLMFNACVRNPTFVDIISQKSYSASITGADGTVRAEEWIPTNYYSAGEAAVPEGVNILGGKTGTTDEAGSCVILYNQDMEANPYISIIMGANDKTILYDDMTKLLSAGVAGN